jgi:PAS domain S-box-containing protein
VSEPGSEVDELTKVGDRIRDAVDPVGLLVSLFAHAPIPLQVYRADGCSLVVNAAFRTLFGREPGPDHNVFDDEVARRKGLVEPIRLGFTGKVADVPATWWGAPDIARTDVEAGQRIAIETSVLPLFDADGVAHHVAVVFRDVTAQMQLAAEHARLTALMGHATDATCLQAPNGSMLYLSPSASHVIGYATQGDIARFWEEILQPTDLARFRGVFEAALQRPGEPLAGEYRVRSKDGTWRWLATVTTNLLFDPDVRAIATHLRDITARRRIEEAIRASETQLAVTLDSIADCVIATDTDGRVTRMNPAAERLTGWILAETRGRHLCEIFAIFNEQTGAAVDCPVTRVLDEGEIVGLANHTILKAKDGTERPIADSAAPIRDAGGQIRGVVLVFRDQTDQRAALRALHESEARFRAMSDCSPLGIFVTNAKFQTVYANPAMCQMVGLGLDELMGQGWASTIHPEDRSRMLAEVRRCNETGSELRTVVRHVQKDGRVVSAHVQTAVMHDGDTVLGIVGTAIDVTERLAARDAIEKARRDLVHLIEKSPDGIAVAHQGRWIYVNNTLARMLGYESAEQIRGRHVSELVHPDDWPAVEANIARANGGVDLEPTETRYRRADGEYAVFERSFARLDEFDGAPGDVLTFRDVTEKRNLQAQVLMSERMVSIGTLAAGMAHEINNPLATVLGNLDWLSSAFAAIREACAASAGEAVTSRFAAIDEALHDARDAGDRIRHIARDVKLFSRAEEEITGPVCLINVLDSAVRMAHNEVRHRARLVKQYAELPMVFGNEARLAQVFLNLLMNAAQAIPEGNADKNEIRVSAGVDSDGQVAVEVRDTGCGIAPSALGRIFDPFFTTKPIGVGVGLGLTICHRIVTGFGGTIAVESKPGDGSLVRVRLRQATSDRAHTPPRPPPAVPSRRARVLVIDDDDAVAATMSRVLGERHDVQIVTRARTALDLLDAGRRYDVVFCDVMMPETSGMDFFDHVASRYPDIAASIVFITGGAFSVPAREFLDRVPNKRVEKPFDADALLALVAERVR